MQWNICRSLDSTICCLLKSFFIHIGGGWLIKSVCFWWSEPALDAAREQAWVMLPIEREREKACSALASRVSPLQRPIQLPLMTAALSVSPLSRVRSLFEEEQRKENGKSIKKKEKVRSLNLKVMGGFRMPWLCRLISAGDWLCRWCAWWSLPSAGGRHWSAALIYLWKNRQ